MSTSIQFPAADAILEFLSRKGINTFHNYPGGTIAPMLDACHRFNTKIFTARTEQGAGYAALAYAKLNNLPGVVAVTSGPGVTNVMTCVADAYFDSYPMLILSGQVSTNDLIGNKPIRQSGFQEVNTPELMRTITKAQFQPKSTQELSEILPLAWHIAMDGRKGPVSIDLPMNIQRESISFLFKDYENNSKQINNTPEIMKFIETLSTEIKKSKKPVIICGNGMINLKLNTKLKEILQLWPSPVSHTLLGVGAIPTDSELNLGFHGHTGSQVAGIAISESDLILILGSRLDVRQTGTLTSAFAPHAKKFRIDFDKNEIVHSRIKSDVVIHANLEDVLPHLIEKIKEIELPCLDNWHNRVRELKANFPWPQIESCMHTKEISPIDVIQKVSSIVNTSVICTTGVGSHQHWVARHFKFDYPTRQLFTSAGHGAMGFDLPTAIGMAYHSPKSTVLCIVGDGSFQMNIQELAMIAELNLNVKVIILDNKRLALVSQFQLMNWSDDTACGNKPTLDYTLIAKAYRIPSIKIDSADDVDRDLNIYLKKHGPAVIHIAINPQSDISPMLLGGQSLDKMWPYYDIAGNLMVKNHE